MNALNLRPPRVAALRAEDMAPFQALVAAVCDQRRNALVVCEDEVVLDAIGVQLARALRPMPQVQMELYLPSSTESLLGRFNGMLADLPLDLARTSLQSHGRLRVWVLHLTRRQELPEVQLLLKLVQGFPGAGVRLLLLFSEEVAAEQSVAMLGSRLHRWTVEGDTHVPDDADDAEQAPHAAVDDEARPQGALQRLKGKMRVPRLQGAMRLPKMPGAVRLLTGLPARQWALGVGGLSLSLAAAGAAWWQVRGQGSSATPDAVAPPTRAVPEIVEYVDPRTLPRLQGADSTVHGSASARERTL